MKLNDILAAIDNNTKIRLTMTMYGMRVSTDHYGDYFLDNDKTDELLERRVTDMRVVENKALEIVLESE